jgi:hypothetical protein
VRPSYTVTSGGVTGPRVMVGGPEPIPSIWLSGASALAGGIISTSTGPAPPFAATWDFFEIVPEPGQAPPDNPIGTPSAITPPQETTPVPPVLPTPAPLSNLFSFGKPKLNKKLGTATLPVTVRGPGTLVLTDKDVVGQELTPTAAGTVNLQIKVKGAKLKALAAGKVKVNLTVTFTPTGGTPKDKSKALVLKKLAQPRPCATSCSSTG